MKPCEKFLDNIMLEVFMCIIFKAILLYIISLVACEILIPCTIIYLLNT